MTERIRPRHARIPSLDGLRAISIILVLIGHLAGTRGFPLSAATGNRFAVAEIGVHVFFVISGFLITGLLLDEYATTNRIRLRRFYFRRTLRIFPPYYTFIVAVVVAQAFGLLTLHGGDAARAISYTSNYDAGRSWWVGHTWSLSVEEQFYLLWPATLVLLGLRRAAIVSVAVVVLTPLVRLGELQFLPAYAAGIGHRFETVADAIAIGCVLACSRDWLHRQRLYTWFQRSPLFLIVPVLLFAGSMLGDHPHVAFLIGQPVANVATMLLVDWGVSYPEGRVGRLLNRQPVVWVGWLSYSLYLWQQPFFNRTGTAWWNAFPANVVFVVALAVGSYYLVEQPSLAFRKRLEGWRTRARSTGRIFARSERSIDAGVA